MNGYPQWPELFRWLTVLKDRVETLPSISAEQVITGTFDPSLIPPIPWDDVLKAGSSLGDLETRSAGDLSSGTLLDARMPALTGDVSSVVGTVATTLATVNASPGTYGSGASIPLITVNGKGLVTDVMTTPIVLVTGGYTVGDLLYANSLTTLAELHDVALGSVLVSGGVATAPAWSSSPRLDGTLEFANTNGASPVLWAQHDPTITGTIGTGSGNVGGFKFGLNYQPFPFTNGPVGPLANYVDDVWEIGPNIGTTPTASGISRVDVTKAAYAISFESKYYDGTRFGSEFHVQGVSADGLTFFRPFSIFMAHDASYISVADKVDVYSVQDKGSNSLLTITDSTSTIDIGSSAQSLVMRFAKNNVSAIQQLNSTGSYVDLLFLDSTNIANVAAPLNVVSARKSSVFATFQPTTANSGDFGLAVLAPSLTGTYTAFRCGATITGPLRFELENQGVASGDSAALRMLVSGASGGDPFAFFSVQGVTNWSLGCRNADADKIYLSPGSTLATTPVWVVDTTGHVGVSVTSPTAILHLKAGTATANTAPLKFNSGTNLTTAEAGAIEFTTDDYFATITTGAARKAFVLDDGTRLTSGRVPFATTNGRLIDDADLTFATDTLSATKVAMSSLTSGKIPVASTAGLLIDGPTLGAAGLKIPAIQAESRSTAQVAAVASVATFTVGAADSSFFVSANVNVTASTLHSFSVQVDYTDETNTAQTLTLTFSQLSAALVSVITNATGAGPYEGLPLQIRCKASTAITVKTTGTFTTVVYNVEGSITQIA